VRAERVELKNGKWTELGLFQILEGHRNIVSAPQFVLDFLYITYSVYKPQLLKAENRCQISNFLTPIQISGGMKEGQDIGLIQSYHRRSQQMFYISDICFVSKPDRLKSGWCRKSTLHYGLLTPLPTPVKFMG